MNNADPSKTVARADDARPTLSFHNAGVEYAFEGAPIYVVAERVDTNPNVSYIVGPSHGRYHMWEAEGRLAPGQTVLLTRMDVQPLHGFTGRVGPVPSRAAAPRRAREDPLAPTSAEWRTHYAHVLSEVGGLPSLPLDLESELPRALELVELAVEAAAHRCAPINMNVTAESVHAWEAVRPFQSRLVEAVGFTLSDALRDALRRAGTDFLRIYCVGSKVQADRMYLRPDARGKPVGVPYIDRAIADSWRRLKRFTLGQHVRVATWRAQSGEEESDPFVMEERIESGAAAIEVGAEPDRKALPYNVLVAHPPDVPRKSFPNDEQLSEPGSEDSPSRAEEERQRREIDPLTAIEAAEAERALRGLARDPLDHAILDALRDGERHGCWSEIAAEYGMAPSSVTRRRDDLVKRAGRAAS